MVRWRTCCGLLAAVLSSAGPAAAAPDWGPAGGGIFAPVPAAEPQIAAAGTPPPLRAQPYQAEIDAAAQRSGIDPKLLRALVIVESAYRPTAISAAGAAGLTQLMPRTASALGIADRFDVASNLTGGADYLARQLARFGDLRLALAAYNAGPERVARRREIPPIPETRAYVAKVVECFLALSAGRPVRSAAECGGGR